MDGIIYATIPNYLPFVLIKWPIIAVLSLLGLGLAFVPINDLPLDRWIVAFLRSITAPTKRIWRKEPKSLDYLLPTFVTAPTQTTQPVLRADRSKLDNYLKTVKEKKEDNDPLEDYEKKFLSSLNFSTEVPSNVVTTETPKPIQDRQATITQSQNSMAMPAPSTIVAAHHSGDESTYITKVGNTDQRIINPRAVAALNPKLPISGETPQVPAAYIPVPPQRGKLTALPIRNTPVLVAAAPPVQTQRLQTVPTKQGPTFPTVDAATARITQLFSPTQPSAPQPAPQPVATQATPTATQTPAPAAAQLPTQTTTGVAVNATGQLTLSTPPVTTPTNAPTLPVTNPIPIQATAQPATVPAVPQQAPMTLTTQASITPTPQAPAPQAPNQNDELTKKLAEMQRQMDVMQRKYVTSENHPMNIAQRAFAESAAQAGQSQVQSGIHTEVTAQAPAPQINTTPVIPATTPTNTPVIPTPSAQPQQASQVGINLNGPQVVQAQPAIGRMAPPKPYYPNVISGWVKDGNGQLVTDVVLMIKDPAGNPKRALKSNKIGKFAVAVPLPNGVYHIEAEKAGYKFNITEVTLNGTILTPIEIKAL